MKCISKWCQFWRRTNLLKKILLNDSVTVAAGESTSRKISHWGCATVLKGMSTASSLAALIIYCFNYKGSFWAVSWADSLHHVLFFLPCSVVLMQNHRHRWNSFRDFCPHLSSEMPTSSGQGGSAAWEVTANYHSVS